MNEPKVHCLSDYQPYPYEIRSVDLTFDLYETHTLVRSVMNVQYSGPPTTQFPPFALDGRDLELEVILMGDRPLKPIDYQLENENLVLTPTEPSFLLDIITRIYPQTNTALEGLYKSGGMFCTQCEAEGFRRITFFPDRPDVMAPYTCTLIAERQQYPVLLSNGNRVQTGTLENGRHWAKWEDPFKKPCYLFALVAGDLHCHQDHFETRSGRTIQIEIYVEHPDKDKCDHAAASLKKAMQWDEINYDREYDLDVYMIVAVHHFNMGAMENKGLNIFNAQYVLAQPETATDMDYEYIQAVIAHEYFHNWTGNRITLRNWFQLSLKEGLTVFRDQQFTADMTSVAVKRIQDVKKLRQLQFPEDAGPMSHPVRPTSYIQMNNFYTHTVYEKGAEVIRMMHTLLGPDGFAQGMAHYFESFDGQAVTTDDFVDVMQQATEYNLEQFRRWYAQSGTPVVKVTPGYDPKAGTYCLKFDQSLADKPENQKAFPLTIPIRMGLLSPLGQPLPLNMKTPDANKPDPKGPSAPTEMVLELTQPSQEFIFQGLKEAPVPSLLRHFSAPVKLEIDLGPADLTFIMNHDPDLVNRWDASQTLLNQMFLSMIEAYQQKKQPVVEPAIVKGIRKLLLESHKDRSFAALMLTLPSQVEIANSMIEQRRVVDPDAIAHVRHLSLQTIAQNLGNELDALYHELNAHKQNDLDHAGIADRRLKNTILYYLAHSNHPAHRNLAFSQLAQAANMTDELGALAIVADLELPDTDRALNDFYQKWQNETLVVNKWLSVQSASQRGDVIARILKLSDHPSFSMKNPNKVRALIGTFSLFNHQYFHDASGTGYRLVADRIIALNELNPQIAARLATVFNRWKHYDDDRQTIIKSELRRIKETPRLSENLFEIVSKALS